MAGEERVAHVLWTGGWDSTFRVLQLALVERRPVQPHYIVPLDRPSSILELRAMGRIRRGLAHLDADAARRIRPTRIVSVRDIEPDPEIDASLARLRKRSHLGTQYGWLAGYVRQSGLEWIELGVHLDDRTQAFLRNKWVPVDDDGNGSVSWRLGDEHAGTDLVIFRGFRLPLYGMSKLEMREVAARAGFAHLLRETWFCFTPIRGRPCGMCSPCMYAVEEGMASRLPARALLRYRLRRVRAWRARGTRAAKRRAVRVSRMVRRQRTRWKRRAVRMVRRCRRALRRLIGSR